MDSRSRKDGGVAPEEWVVPACFTICAGWLVWHMSAFTLDWAPPEDGSAFDRLSAQYRSNDVAPNLSGLFGGFADLVDYLALLGIAVFGILGAARVRKSHLEHYRWSVFDRISVFAGRSAMILIVTLVSVMFYEVLLRYVFENPTKWANELSLWIAGFVFLLAGLYAMQQRSHIRIFIVYDLLPRGLQKVCDAISVTLTWLFVAGLWWGGYDEASAQFYRWETLGTYFDPPVPATITPAVLIVVTLVGVQALSNLIRDWNQEPIQHSTHDEPDREEIETLRRAVGGNRDVD